VGFDTSAALRWKSMAAAGTQALPQLEFRAADVVDLPLPRESQDVVLANGLLHLIPDQAAAIAEMARVLRPGGRLAISDLVCSQRIPDRVADNVDCWVQRVGGLMSHASYYQALLSAGFDLRFVRPNTHFQFSCDESNLSANAYGISSVSVLAIKREC
jgi:ubiquinone/menaquinone biosynthesis C-methylase UbiE